MVDFYLPLKILRGRLSPNKEDPQGSAAMAENASSSKRQFSEDDPFNDKKRSKSHEGSASINGNEHDPSPFIKKQNLDKIQSKTMVVPATSDEGDRTLEQADEEEEGEPEAEEEEEEEEEEVAESEVQSDEEVAEEEEEETVAAAEPQAQTHQQEHVEAEHTDTDEIDEVPLEVLEEMHKLETCFPTLSSNYRLIDKIGEGTFSTVYKAEAINGAVRLGSDIWKSPPLKKSARIAAGDNGDEKKSLHTKKNKNPIVALKQIYVSSSPNRIHNELKLLFLLTGNSHVAPLLDILRYHDQVLAIMPYYMHADYRDFYRDLPIKGVKKYMWELFHALSFIHDKDVIHRDLKPTNFLYDPFRGKGVLVDFGLAEKMERPQSSSSLSASSSSSSKSILCPCLSKERQSHSLSKSTSKRHNVKAAYPKQDQRPPRRANRAGTRGFRAPEVLFKCTNQSTKLDIWSAGIIGLSFLARKFPLFNSPDDIDALLELVLVFGYDKLHQCAELHGCGLEINLPHINTSHKSGNLVQVVADFLRFEWENCTFPSDSVALDTLRILSEQGDSFENPNTTPEEIDNYNDHVELIHMLNGCFKMDPTKRLSAKEILKTPFFKDLMPAREEDEVIFED